MEETKKTYITDLVGNDYLNWKPGDKIIFDAGTGTGKTVFSLNILSPYAKEAKKKVLYLCNRHKLMKKIEKELKKWNDEAAPESQLDNVTLMTYQELEMRLRYDEYIGRYDYIIADEIHYITSDALFNEYTDLSYNFLMVENQESSVVIFMSATATVFFDFLIRENYTTEQNKYHIDMDYSYVNNVYFFNKNQLTEIIEDIYINHPEDKILVFLSSGERMKEMYDYCKMFHIDASFYCAEGTNNKTLRRICSNDCIDLDNSTFHSRVLFSTTALDNGVDLKDPSLRHVITEIMDIDKMVQSLGRKRSLTPDQTCDFYIRNYNRALQGRLNRVKEHIQPAYAYRRDPQSFFEANRRNRDLTRNKLFYIDNTSDDGNVGIRLNMMVFNKYQMDEYMLEEMKKKTYVQYVTDTLGGEKIASKVQVLWTKQKEKDLLFELLKSLEKKWIYVSSDEMHNIREAFQDAGLQIRKGVKNPMNSYNGFLDDNYKTYKPRFRNKDENGKSLCDYRRSIDGEPNKNYKKSYWLLE